MRFLVLTAIGGGIVAGFLARGSFSALSTVRLSWAPVLIVSLVVGTIPYYVALPSGPRKLLQFLAHAGVLAFLSINVARSRGGVRAGIVIAALGWLLNAIVIVANGGMPLSVWAYAESGQTMRIEPGRGGFFRIVVAGPDTVLRPLGDVIPVRAIGQVVSIGDLVLMVGIAVVIAAGMARGRRIGDRAAAPQ